MFVDVVFQSVHGVRATIRGLHPWLTILLLPGLWACNIVLSHEHSLGFIRFLIGFCMF